MGRGTESRRVATRQGRLASFARAAGLACAVSLWGVACSRSPEKTAAHASAAVSPSAPGAASPSASASTSASAAPSTRASSFEEARKLAQAGAWTDPLVVAQLTRDCRAFEATKEPESPFHTAGEAIGCRMYFEQSCVYDPCRGELDTCQAGCAKSCDHCASDCSDGCEKCKGGCEDDACRSACATSCATCRQTCGSSRDTCATAGCAKKQESCDAREAKFDAQNRCAQRCEAALACARRCYVNERACFAKCAGDSECRSKCSTSYGCVEKCRDGVAPCNGRKCQLDDAMFDPQPQPKTK